MKMKFTVDRIEEGKLVLVLPDGKTKNMDISFCPEAKEGDIIDISLDEKEKEFLKKRITDKLLRLKTTR